MSNMQDLLRQVAEKTAKETHEARIDTLIRIQAALFDKAAAYTNLILVAGYAAFFTVWVNSDTFLAVRERQWSVLLIMISLLLFILFEVYKALYNARQSGRFLNLISAPIEEFDDQLAAVQAAEHRAAMWLMRIWRFTFPITLVVGLSGAGVLIFGFVRSLFFS